MKKYVSCILCSLFLINSLCSCSVDEVKQSEVTSQSSEETYEETTTVETDAPDITTEETTAETTVKKESHYTFQTHVSSTLMNEIMEDEMLVAYNNFIDAVMAGETSFECADQDTYNWVMGQYAYLLFPVVAEYVGIDGYRDGMGYFFYKIPLEEFQEKLQEFEDLVVDILNSCLEDDYSDFEKALALYYYFIENYVYDYDIYYAMKTEYQENVSGYRLLTEKTGICQEISVAYSYLLLQAGVDATVLKAQREYDNETHQWSLVTIDGKYYHIDPTYGLGLLASLDYFMMTDEIRYDRDYYNSDKFIPSTVYAQFNEFPDISVTDDTYSVLWGNYILDWDADKNVITYIDDDGHEQEFCYGDV